MSVKQLNVVSPSLLKVIYEDEEKKKRKQGISNNG
jgi:hypothetical protein